MIEKPSFSVNVDLESQIVRLVLIGHWDVPIVAGYEQQRREALDSLYAAGHHASTIGVIINALGFEVQSQAVFARLDTIAHMPQDALLHVAVIQSRVLGKIQAKRMDPNRYNYFENETDAIAWIKNVRTAAN